MTLISKRSLLFLLLAAFASLSMLFAACGGGDDDDDSGGDDTTATATATDSGDDGGDDGGDETPTNDSGDDGGDDTSGDPFEDLLNLTGEYENVKGTVTYETTDESGIVSTFTLYSDPENNRSRFDSSDESGGTFILITTTDATYTCTATTEDDGFCLQSEGSDDAAGLGLLGLFASPALLGAYVDQLSGIDVETSSDEIAGTDADCFSWNGEIEGESGSGKICFASNGIMLSADFEGSDGTVTHMRATEVSDEVSDSDFDPPFDQLEIPGQ